MEFLDWLDIAGGVCTTVAAREHLSTAGLRRLRDTGRLWVPLRGWVALDGVRNDVTRALELGGVASCVTAFRLHELWVPHGEAHLHMRANRETHSDRVERASRTDGVELHRMHLHLPDPRPWDGVDTVESALAVATGCISADDLIAAAESALSQGKVQPAGIQQLAAKLPRRRRLALQRASRLSGSGTESVFAAMLRRSGIDFEQQPELLPGEFVDFLIGRSLVVEIDSLEWHGSREQMARDRARDARLTALGYRVVRFTYEQVMFDPASVLETVLGFVRRNVHVRALFRPAA